MEAFLIGSRVPFLRAVIAFFVNVIVNEQIGVNSVCFGLCNRSFDAIERDVLADEEFYVGLCWTSSQDILGFSLKPRDKILVAFVCNNGELVDFVDIFTERIEVHAVAVNIYAQAEAAANFLLKQF